MADFDSADFDIDFEIDEVAAEPRVLGPFYVSPTAYSIPVSRSTYSIEVS